MVRELSQPGQFLSEQRVSLVGEKGTLCNVAVLGPVRARTQVEITRSDCYTLGLKNVPLKQSGDLEGTPGILIRSETAEVYIKAGVIVSQRHIHMSPGKKFKDGQIVSVRFPGERGGVLDNFVVRVSENFAPAIHIDADEGNALGFTCGSAEVV